MATERPYEVEQAARLRALSRELTVPAPAGNLTTAVMERIAGEPVPVQRRRLTNGLSWRPLVAAVLGVLVTLALIPPVRAAVVDLFDFVGIIVRYEPAAPPETAPPPPTTASGVSIDEAGELVGFSPAVPSLLGAPDGVAVSPDHRVLSMTWTGGPDGTVRVDQFDGRVSPVFVKEVWEAFEFTTVRSYDALWFSGPHKVVVLQPDGVELTEFARLAGRTLVWEDGGTTFRLEGDLTRERAVAIAESTG